MEHSSRASYGRPARGAPPSCGLRYHASVAAPTSETKPGRVQVPEPILVLGIVVILLGIGAAFFVGRVLAPGPEDETGPGAVLSADAVPQAAIDIPGQGRLVLDNIWQGDNGPYAVVRVEGTGLDTDPANWVFVATGGTTLVPRNSDHGNGNTLLWLDRPLPAGAEVVAVRYKSGDTIAEFRLP